MWLSDLLPPKEEIRPTRPTSKNNVGRQKPLVSVTPPDTPDTPDTKKEKNISSREIHHKEEGITQTSYKNPESARHLPLESETADAPPPEQIAHARRMLVDCPSTKGKRHCWHCSRCAEARTCTAWRTRRADVERFRQSGKPYSLYLVEGGEEEAPGLSDWLELVAPGPTPDYAAFCSSYWRGCFECPDFLAEKLRFCARYNRLNDKAAEVEQ